jgi:hypothetical protein
MSERILRLCRRPGAGATAEALLCATATNHTTTGDDHADLA